MSSEAVTVLLIVALGSALAVVRVRRSYAPVAGLYLYILVVDQIRAAILPVYTAALAHDRFNAVLAFDRLLVLGWWFLPLALAVRFFLHRPPGPVFGGWLLAWAPIANYAWVHGPSFETVLRGYALALLAATWVTIAWGIVRTKDLQPGVAHLAVMLWAATDFAIDILPLAHAFHDHWALVRAANAVLYVTMIVVHGVVLYRERRALHATG